MNSTGNPCQEADVVSTTVSSTGVLGVLTGASWRGAGVRPPRREQGAHGGGSGPGPQGPVGSLGPRGSERLQELQAVAERVVRVEAPMAGEVGVPGDVLAGGRDAAG